VAPSPTGDPHVGTAYQALFNKAFAERTGGQFLLRIEDTDQTRSTRASEEMIFRALRWLGLGWDEGPDVGGPHAPYRQSERTAIYREHADLLLERGAAYPCFCKPERLESLRAAQEAAKQPPRYDRTCSAIPPDEARARAASEPHVVRLLVPPEGSTVVHDELRGDVAFENLGVDDQVLLKSDGFPTYHLANVVDDHLMEITHVIRGEEWLPSTPKHVLLYEGFGWRPPRFLHTPLLRNPDRSKFSKRKNPTSLDWYRGQGFLPEAMVNFLGTLGWSHPDGSDFFSYAQFVERFDWDRVSLAGPIFDMAKLTHLNGLWIRSKPVEEVARLLLEGGFTRHGGADRALFMAAVALIHDRLTTLVEFDDLTAFFFDDPAEVPVKDLVGKAGPNVTRDVIEAVRRRLEDLRPWAKEGIEATVRELAGASPLRPRDVFMSLRVASTGRTVSTPLFETMAAIGRDATLRRLTAACNLL
jgi:glutamyl-tRNA synthetase